MRTAARNSLLLLLVMIAAGLFLPWQEANAARTINSVLLDYSTQIDVTSVTVPPGATITATVNVTHSGAAAARRWRSSSWRVGAGAFTCVDHANFDTSSTDNVTFTITAPIAAGTYNAEFLAWQENACGTSSSATFTLVNGVIVGPSPANSTVVASPTSVPADGVTTSTITVTLLDGNKSPVAGKTVTLTAGSGSSIISAASGPSNASGVVTFTVSNTVVQSVTYTATDTTDAITVTQTATVSFTVPPPIAGFNVVEPGAAAVAGRIFTKIAGVNFAVDIVALTAANAVATGFTGNVTVEIVDNTSGGGCAGLPLIATLTTQTFTAANAGRHPLSAPNTVANSHRNAKFRIKYPTASPTVTSCSGDNFAIRPQSLAFAAAATGWASDATRTTAGTTTTLNNMALAAATVHNAGRPLTLRTTAYNGAATPAITSNYNGAPTAVLTACGGTACTATAGALSVGTWTASGGTVTTTTATYDDVGAFMLQLEDATYAAVDNADGTPAAQLTISSTPSAVGRFVPDRFILSLGSSLTPRSGIGACSASSFTYLGERMDATYTLTAVRFPSGTTTRYAGTLARLVLTSPASFNFGAIDGAVATQLTSRIDTSLGSSGTWAAGVANVTAVIAIDRNATPDGPYSAVRIGIAPTDPDAVALDATAFNVDADNSGSNERAQIGAVTALRFGRMRVQNTHGSQLIAMTIPVLMQYWNGTAFVTNTADSCTDIAVVNIALGNYQKNLSSGETTASVTATIASGVGSLRLSAPGAANYGSVDVSVNLSSLAAGTSCTAGMPASSGLARTYLQGAWCGPGYNRDPTARATFGLYRASDKMIYQFENF